MPVERKCGQKRFSAGKTLKYSDTRRASRVTLMRRQQVLKSIRRLMIVHGEWLLTPARVAVHLPTATAVLADLHLGYNEARRRDGEAVPAANLALVLAPLTPLIVAQAVRRVVIAGDLFEAGPSAVLAEELLTWMKAAGVELAGVAPGNHDRGFHACSHGLPVHPDGVAVGRWRVVHGDERLPDGPVVHGHDHPCVRWSGRVGGLAI